VLALKVSMEADEEDDDGDGNEGCAKWLSDFAKVVERLVVRVAFAGDAGAKTEELCDGDTDAGKGEGGSEPG
jgi:hypothetical protein